MKHQHVPALLAFATLTVSAHAQSPMATAAKMASEYRTATLKKDFAGFEKSSTPDFTYVDRKGRKTTKAQAIGGMKGFYSMLTIKSLKVTALSSKATPGGLTYIQESMLVGSMKMGGPKPSVITSHTRDEVTVVKVGGKWLTKKVKNLMTDDKVDGKPMPGM